jgi:hypothetical protein
MLPVLHKILHLTHTMSMECKPRREQPVVEAQTLTLRSEMPSFRGLRKLNHANRGRQVQRDPKKGLLSLGELMGNRQSMPLEAKDFINAGESEAAQKMM